MANFFSCFFARGAFIHLVMELSLLFVPCFGLDPRGQPGVFLDEPRPGKRLMKCRNIRVYCKVYETHSRIYVYIILSLKYIYIPSSIDVLTLYHHSYSFCDFFHVIRSINKEPISCVYTCVRAKGGFLT